MLAAVLLAQLGFGLTIAAIRLRSNDHGAAESVRHMEARLSQIAADLTSIANDYNHWTEAYEALRARDAGWVAENYGLSAMNGEIFDGVIFFDGPLAEPWAWSAADPRTEPSPAFLGPDLLDRIRREVAPQPLGARATYDTVTVIEGRLSLVSATRTQPSDDALPKDLDPAGVPVAVLTETLGPVELASLADTLSFGALEFGPAPVAGWASLEVPGPDGTPAGVLSWTPPRPGDALVTGMLPVLAGLVAMNIALGAAAAWLAGSRARSLIRESERASALARTDPMTGLPNRLAFNTHLEELERRRMPQVGVLFIDVNGFKAVNDSLGHAVGDRLMVEVGRRLDDCRDGSVVLARLGGDEFAFVLAGEEGLALKAEVLSCMVARAMGEPFTLLGAPLHVTLSQGLALRHAPHLPLEEVLRRADVAMYRAKRDRLLDVQVHTPEIDGEMRRDLDLEVALRAALDRPDEFEVVYQPIVQSRDESLTRPRRSRDGPRPRSAPCLPTSSSRSRSGAASWGPWGGSSSTASAPTWPAARAFRSASTSRPSSSAIRDSRATSMPSWPDTPSSRARSSSSSSKA